MESNKLVLPIYIGWDSREQVATEVAAHSIRKRTKTETNIQYLKHRELRKKGLFKRPWLIESEDGGFRDLIDNRPFSTEFSHTRFLVPALQQHKGWALFFDADMIFLSDVLDLFKYARNKYAVMVVKHNQVVKENQEKMDGRLQLNYYRKNWSSFILWNCEHPSNKKLTKEFVNMAKGSDLHSFCWLRDEEIGSLPMTYNYISGVSPPMPVADTSKPELALPNVIHYTEGGPWFPEYKDCPLGQVWIDEYEDFQRSRDDGAYYTEVSSISFDIKEK